MKLVGLAVGLCLLSFLTHQVEGQIFTECGGFLENNTGFIQSPNFPARFPTPLSCHWVIHAPPEKKIIIYFTQYFLREGFYLSEYDHYDSEVAYIGKKNLGEINFEDEFTYFVAYKPYVVINLNVRDNGNIHLRVEEYLQNVYGFNITYEVVDLENEVRKDTCSVHECSFLGHCVANHNYSEYRCDCFDDFFGDECQYGPFCDPDQGTNMCKNGGRCRYFYGSLVNTCECPIGFEGSKCHIKTDRPLNQDCEKLGCSQLCEKSGDGNFFCSCIEGYKLDADNVTCREKEMFRVTVEAPIRLGTDVPRAFTSKTIDVTSILAPKVKHTLQLSDITSFTQFGFDGIRQKGGRSMIVFHFYVENNDLNLVNLGLKFLTIGSKLFGVSIDQEALSYETDPEMKLLGVQDYGARPAVEGKLLTIMCKARGSSHMEFKWFKDGSLLNTTLSQRNAWEIRIPRTIQNKQISVLNIDGVEFYDKGEFTCVIEDFGITDNTSVIIDVTTLPLLEMSPLAVSLNVSESTSFRCLSPDDTIAEARFTYVWLKNGNPIPQDAEHETVEDVFPTGRRLFIRNAQESANYTCRISNPAGSANKTAFLFVRKQVEILGHCERNIYEGVTWEKTFGECFDIQRCPTDTGDERTLQAREEAWLLRVNGYGYSRRWCRCTDGRCNWTKPNFVKCQSGHLITIFDRLEKIKLGYQHEELEAIWEDLYGLITQARGKLYAGDVDVSSSILHTLVKTLAQHPSLAPQQGKFSFVNLLNFTNILMAEALLTTDDEKELIYVGPKVMQIAEMIGSLHLRTFEFHDGLHISFDKIVMDIQKMKVVPPNATVPVQVSFLERDRTRSSRLRRGDKYKPVLNGHSAHPIIRFAYEPMLKYQFIDMYALLHDNYEEKIIDPDFITDMTSVFLFDNFYLQRTKKVQILLPHPDRVILAGFNETRCISWRTIRSGISSHKMLKQPLFFYADFVGGMGVAHGGQSNDVLNGHWSYRDCDVVQRNMTSTTCWCEVPGHFAVIVKQINVTIPVIPETYEGILLTGSIVSMCGLLATLIVYIFTWRHLVGDDQYIHVNFILSLTIVNAICITCIEKSKVETLCAAAKILLQFFYIAAFAFLFVEAVNMFVVVHARQRTSRNFLKYFLIGWGIPTLATGSVVVASERYGYDEICLDWCYLSLGHWHFYSFLFPVSVLVMAQVTLSCISVGTVWRWKEEWRYKDRRKHMIEAGKSGIIQILLKMTCVTGMVLEHSKSVMYFYVLVNIVLGWTVFICFVLTKRQVRISLKYVFKRPGYRADMARKLSSRSFKAYMMPEKIDERGETIEETIHRHQSEINRNKFTRERKKHLESLLGSSNSASSNSAGSTSGSSSAASRESQIRFLLTPVLQGDSGIVSCDTSEQFSMKNAVGIHYISSVPENVDTLGTGNNEDFVGDKPSDRFLPGPMTDLPLVTVHAS